MTWPDVVALLGLLLFMLAFFQITWRETSKLETGGQQAPPEPLWSQGRKPEPGTTQSGYKVDPVGDWPPPPPPPPPLPPPERLNR